MNQLTLTADSGSTKTDWLLTSDAGTYLRLSTAGINPFMLSESEIASLLSRELVPQMQGQTPVCVRFYGAGCRGEGIRRVEQALRHTFATATEIEVASDLIGAAKALFGTSDGIACILGTGSNSGLWLGGKMTANVPPLGYILGDEGSGAVLGKRLIGDLFKGLLPPTLVSAFRQTYALDANAVIERVYRQPFANKYLASFAPFLSAHRDKESVQTLLREEFTRFFHRNVNRYTRPDLPVSFVGSVAYYFSEELTATANACGYTIGKILRQPLDHLL